MRKTLLLPLDDLLAVTREFLCESVSRSGLDRCLRRHGVGNLNALKPKAPQPEHKTFSSYTPGYVHVDVKYLPQMQGEDRRRYLFVAIDRATRWVFVQIRSCKTAASAKAFLHALHKACPMRITRLLTDNGREFTDRLFASKEREPSGHHEFERLCGQLGIEHRLTRPRTPKTNGMVERFNGRIADVLKTHRFNSAEDLEQTLMRYVHLYPWGAYRRPDSPHSIASALAMLCNHRRSGNLQNLGLANSILARLEGADQFVKSFM